MAAFSFKSELESQLKEAGNKLSMPPSSIKELLDLLDKVEDLLSYVGQEPSGSMWDALLPSMGALISNELLRHSDVDVKVSVASCISEITRITAPERPYNDEIMKEIFQLNVMAFEKLSHVSGRCYSKALHILSSTASVQSFLLMMDLEFNNLFAEMFQQFLRTIRSSHPHDVFPNMEKIMTKVIEESEDVSVELLSLLLSSVRKENQNVSPISWKLGETILNNCTGILKAYLPVMMQSKGLDPDNYAEVVASICQRAEIPKKRERRPNSRFGGYLRWEEIKYELDHRKKKGDDSRNNEVAAKTRVETSPTPNNIVVKEGILRDAEGIVAPSAEKVKDKKRKRGKATSGEKLVSPSATTSTERGGIQCSEASKKSAPPKDQDHKINEYGEELVGRRIKVWWPLDQMFYDGAVASFDPLEKKHTVLYVDGDEETLNLHDEQWELLNDMSPDRDWKNKEKQKMVSSVKQYPA